MRVLCSTTAGSAGPTSWPPSSIMLSPLMGADSGSATAVAELFVMAVLTSSPLLCCSGGDPERAEDLDPVFRGQRDQCGHLLGPGLRSVGWDRQRCRRLTNGANEGLESAGVHNQQEMCGIGRHREGMGDVSGTVCE